VIIGEEHLGFRILDEFFARSLRSRRMASREKTVGVS
jgi:hypothetical protein